MSTSRLREIAFIGTGHMGTPMAQRLIGAGHTLRVWNRTPEKLQPLIAAGARPANTPAEAADGADAVFLCVTDRAAVETVVFGQGGVAEAAHMPRRLVDFSTIGPEPTVQFGERLRARANVSWIDAPVSGGATGAQQGTLVIFCGGVRTDVERLRPLLGAFAQRVTYVGPLGAGQALKLCNQLIVSTNLVAIAEALHLARASGLPLGMIPEALAGGFADSLPLQIFGRRMAQGVSTPVLGEIALMQKDLTAIDDLARAGNAALPLARCALEIYRRAAQQGLLHRDLAALLELYAPSSA